MRLFCQDQDQDQDSGSQDQDQDQDFIFCPRGTSRPRLWSRGLHHCSIAIITFQLFCLTGLAPAYLTELCTPVTQNRSSCRL